MQAVDEVFFAQLFAGHQFRVAWLGHELAEPGQQHALIAHVLGEQQTLTLGSRTFFWLTVVPPS